MAQLQWRPVDAPQGSIRDIALAGQTITNSFDRLGDMLARRELALREEAYGAQAAGILTADNADSVKSAVATALASNDPRVKANALRLAQLGNEQQSTLLNRSLTQEQLAAAQDPAKFGAQYAQLQAAAKRAEVTGDQSEVQSLVAQMGGARKIAEYLATGTQLGDTDQNQALDRDQFGETVRHNRAGESAEQQRIRLAAAANARDAEAHGVRMAGLRLEQAQRKDVLAATQLGDRIGRNLPARFTPEDAVNDLHHSKTWANTPLHARGALEESLKASFTRQTTAGTDQLARGGAMASSGVPAYLVPGAAKAAPASYNTLASEAATGLSRSKVVQSALTSRTMAENPYVQAFEVAAGYKGKEPDITEVVKYAQDNTDILGDGEVVNTVKQRYGLSNGEVMGLLKSMDFNSSWTQWGKTGAFERAAKEYSAARDSGDLEKTRATLASKLSPIVASEQKLNQLLERAKRERGAGTPSANTQAQIRALVREMQGYKLED